EKILKDSKIKLQLLYDSSSDAIMLLDEKGFFDCNEATLRLFGCANREEFCSRHPADFSPPTQPDGTDSMSSARNKIAVALKEGSQRFEYLHRRLDGTDFPAEVLLDAFMLEGKKVLQARVYDITEQKAAQEAIRESEERYRSLFEFGMDGILIADIETKRFEYANPALCKMLGYSAKELVKGMSISDIHPKDNFEHVISEFEAQARGEKTLAQNIPCLRKDGTIIYADINTTVALVDGKKCNIGFFRDITERKAAEEESKKRADELEKFNRLAVGRELKMIKLKKEINALLEKSGREPGYKIVGEPQGEVF
ncbi:MAG: PAS domain-containing protein, partial [Deltaproteobacteria bacterium]|nr:PAS domain-containing protein [Deltaproteobacteria bacterium]